MPILKFTESNAVPDAYFLAPEKLIEGNPKQTVWMHYTDASKKFMSGIWCSEVGKWRIIYTEEEYCSILEGTSIITDDLGTAVTVRTGRQMTGMGRRTDRILAQKIRGCHVPGIAEVLAAAQHSYFT